MLFVLHEKNFDRFNKNAPRIYNIYAKVKAGGDTIQFPNMNYSTAVICQKLIPSVKDFSRIKIIDKKESFQQPGDSKNKFFESKIVYADNNFFDFFSFRIKQGNAKMVLSNPYTVVITEDVANKYFPGKDPIGEHIILDDSLNFLITGIAYNPPSNSSINFRFVCSLSTLTTGLAGRKLLQQQSISFEGNFKTFLLLSKQADVTKVGHQIQSLSNSHGENAAGEAKYYLLNLLKVHSLDNFGDTSNIKYLKIFPIIAYSILLLALINYISLVTAKATTRAKEIGVRKINGATNNSLFIQFYLESIFYSIVSLLIGILFFIFTYRLFYHIFGLSISFTFLFSTPVLIFILVVGVITIAIAGSYPAFFLARMNPASILSGKMSKYKAGATVRKIFTILQFAVATVLITGSLAVKKQMNFIQNTNTGLCRKNVIMLPFASKIAYHFETFKDKLSTITGITQVAASSYPLYEGYDMIGIKSNNEQIFLPLLNIDRNFIPLLDIPWKDKPITNNFTSGNDKVVINEEAVSKLNLFPNPLGKPVSISTTNNYRVGGVVKNFNFSSLYDKMQPLCLLVQDDSSIVWRTSNSGCLFIRINPHSNLPILLTNVKNLFQNFDPDSQFQFEFIDEAFNQQYQAEDRLLTLLNIFTFITIIIASLGLFALASFSSSQRIKEIGIRKVLGGTVRSITLLLIKDYFILVGIAILIAAPIAWFIITNWVNNFAYRINLGIGTFLAPAFCIIAVTLFTISSQAIKAASQNAVTSIRQTN